MLLAAGWWPAGALLEHAATAPATKLVYAALEYPGIMAVAPLWLLFALGYAGHGGALGRSGAAALAVVPLITVALVWTNGAHHLVWTSITPSSPTPGAPLVYGHGPWFWLAAAYNYALPTLGTVVLFAVLARAHARYHGQAAALLVGLALPWIGNALSLLGGDRGRPRGRLLVLGDVTERKRTEETLRQTEKLASLGQLLAGVAHELNNPLSVVIGHATLLKRDLISGGPGVARVEKIATAADRC